MNNTISASASEISATRSVMVTGEQHGPYFRVDNVPMSVTNDEVWSELQQRHISFDDAIVDAPPLADEHPNILAKDWDELRIQEG